MGTRCIHYNALPDARILLHVTDKQIEEGFTYSKVRYPGVIFRVYRCEQCNGMMEEASVLLTPEIDIFREYDRQRLRDCLVLTTSHDGRRKK